MQGLQCMHGHSTCWSGAAGCRVRRMLRSTPCGAPRSAFAEPQHGPSQAPVPAGCARGRLQSWVGAGWRHSQHCSWRWRRNAWRCLKATDTPAYTKARSYFRHPSPPPRVPCSYAWCSWLSWVGRVCGFGREGARASAARHRGDGDALWLLRGLLCQRCPDGKPSAGPPRPRHSLNRRPPAAAVRAMHAWCRRCMRGLAHRTATTVAAARGPVPMVTCRRV